MLDPTVQAARRWMLVGMLGIALGGVAFIALMLGSGNYIIGGLVGWGCGFATVIYTSAHRAIAILEAKVASRSTLRVASDGP